MPYPTNLLGEGEKIIRETRLHWIALFKEILYTAGLLILIFILSQAFDLGGWLYGLMILGWVVICFRGVSDWFTSDLVVTNRRVIFRKGLISKKGHEMPVDRIQDVGFSQSALQRMVGSGDLLVESGGSSSRTALRNVPDALGMKQVISNTRETRIDQRLSQAGQGSAPVAGETRVSQLETLARLHEQGSLTDEEFAAEKARLLKEA